VQAFAYIDGFNLYYRAVKGTPYKWLDLRRMCELLVPEHAIKRVKYFTAPVSGRGDIDKPRRQNEYLRALRQSGCEIVLGKFLSREAVMPLANDRSKLVRVWKTEEKGSDVNLATHLLIDGMARQYEVAIVLTNDSDLAMPLQHIRDTLRLEAIVINPDRHTVSKTLMNAATSQRQLREGVLAISQFPDEIPYPKGVIRKPATW